MARHSTGNKDEQNRKNEERKRNHAKAQSREVLNSTLLKFPLRLCAARLRKHKHEQHESKEPSFVRFVILTVC
jgi:hypothetical protein